MLELDFQWPEEVSLLELRPWLIGQFQEYGQPLRWSITSITPSISGQDCLRQLRVELVVIIS